MRQRTIKTRDARCGTVAGEPMNEGLAKKERRPNGFFTKMKDEELVEYAKDAMKEKEISGRKELEKADHGLYYILKKRGLFHEVGLEKKHRERRDWKSMDEKKIVEYAMEFMREKGICRRKELAKADAGLYSALWKRSLLEKVGFERKIGEIREWKSIDDDKLVEYAKRVMKENEIRGRKELEKGDAGLYEVLRKRGLLDKVGFERIKRETRDWKLIDDNKLIKNAKEFMKKNRISGRSELQMADQGLYQVLMRRGLADKVGLANKNDGHRDWKSFDDEKLVEYAKGFIKRNRISEREKLREIDQGQFQALKRRNLLSLVFADIEKTKRQSHEKQLLSGLRLAPEAMEKFGEGK